MIVALIIIVVVQVCVCIYLMWRRGRIRLEDAEPLHQYRNQVTHLPSFDHGKYIYFHINLLMWDEPSQHLPHMRVLIGFAYRNNQLRDEYHYFWTYHFNF